MTFVAGQWARTYRGVGHESAALPVEVTAESRSTVYASLGSPPPVDRLLRGVRMYNVGIMRCANGPFGYFIGTQRARPPLDKTETVD